MLGLTDMPAPRAPTPGPLPSPMPTRSGLLAPKSGHFIGRLWKASSPSISTNPRLSHLKYLLIINKPCCRDVDIVQS